MRDVSELKDLEERLSRLALTDGLTGLSNRRAFDESLEREWLRTLREGSQMSLLILDLDRFKEFNDRYGHQKGDDWSPRGSSRGSFRHSRDRYRLSVRRRGDRRHSLRLPVAPAPPESPKPCGQRSRRWTFRTSETATTGPITRKRRCGDGAFAARRYDADAGSASPGGRRRPRQGKASGRKLHRDDIARSGRAVKPDLFRRQYRLSSPRREQRRHRLSRGLATRHPLHIAVRF